MMTKSQIAADLADMGLGGKQQIANILAGLAEIAEEEIALGNDFTIPGIAKVSWSYRKPQKKGERWKKGDLVTGFGGTQEVKDTDSPPVTARASLKAKPLGKVNAHKPKTDPAVQAAFLKTTTGKAVIKNKG